MRRKILSKAEKKEVKSDPQAFSDEVVGSLLQNLTVIIFTRNRPKYLEGIVHFWSFWPVTLVVLDGSDQPGQSGHLNPQLAKILQHTQVSLTERLGFAATAVNTKYSLLQSDDDFFLPRGVANAIAKMESYSEVDCVTSDAVQFSDDRALGIIPSKTISGATWDQRLSDHFNDYRFEYTYGIHRSQHLKDSMATISAAARGPRFRENSNEALAFELGLEVAGAVLGRSLRLDEVFLFKRVSNSLSSTKDWSTDWISSPNSRRALDEWTTLMGENLAQFSGVNPSAMTIKIMEVMKEYASSVADFNQRFSTPTRILIRLSRALRRTDLMLGSFLTRISNSPNLQHRIVKWVVVVLAVSYAASREVIRKSTKLLNTAVPRELPLESIPVADSKDIFDVIAVLEANFPREFLFHGRISRVFASAKIASGLQASC